MFSGSQSHRGRSQRPSQDPSGCDALMPSRFDGGRHAVEGKQGKQCLQVTWGVADNARRVRWQATAKWNHTCKCDNEY